MHVNSSIFELDDLRPSDNGLLVDAVVLEDVTPAPRHTLVSIISSHSTDDIETTAAGLSALTRCDLDRRLLAAKIAVQAASETGRKAPPAIRLDLWLINQEYTHRGIAPVLRGLPDINDDDPDQIADLFAIDLAWLAARYPKQTPHQRWQGVFEQVRFHRTADWFSSHYPRNGMYWFVRGLNLTKDQQRELHVIKAASIQKELNRLNVEREAVRIRLSAAYHARDSRHKTDDHAATIMHRLHVWFCGSLAGWKPQSTADLYRGLTGEVITRQRASKTIAQVHRDVPESRPRRSRKA